MSHIDKKSHLSIQLAALGLDEEGPRGGGMEDKELSFINAQGLRGLGELPTHFTWYSWRSPGFRVMITVTAVLLALVLPPKDPPQELIRSKGAGKSWIYLEKEGAVKVWDRSGSVNPGERIRVELLASSQQISYMGIINSQHDLISSPSTFVKNALSLEDGQRKAFADSFSLDENIEHESIFILSCPSSSPHGRDSIKDFLFEHKSNVRGIMASLEGCQTEVIRLR